MDSADTKTSIVACVFTPDTLEINEATDNNPSLNAKLKIR
jgi:hypothetical protein